MFQEISWQSYWTVIAVLSGVYYFVIYLLYFRKDFAIKWSRNSKSNEESPFSSFTAGGAASQPVTPEQSTLFHGSEEFQSPAKDTIESAVYTCMDEINAYLGEAKRSKCVKEEMLYALNAILRKYPAIAGSEYKESVTNVVVNQCEYHCSVHLSADDVVKVWVGG
jgi:hypothetical protein